MTRLHSSEPAGLVASRADSHQALWLMLAVAALTALVWLGSLFLGPVAQGESPATPTPTKTPAVPSADSGAMLAWAGPALPTFTPAPPPALPTAVATLPPTPASAGDAPAAWVISVAQSNGLNPAGDYIVVDQNNQQMHVVAQGKLERLLHVSTGNAEFGWETPAWFGVVGDYWGTFQGRGGLFADDGWWLFNRNGGDFLIHSLPYTLAANGDRSYSGWDDLGATPASHGCIRMAPADAAWFSAWQPQGKPIVILPYTGLHGAQG